MHSPADYFAASLNKYSHVATNFVGASSAEQWAFRIDDLT